MDIYIKSESVFNRDGGGEYFAAREIALCPRQGMDASCPVFRARKPLYLQFRIRSSACAGIRILESALDPGLRARWRVWRAVMITFPCVFFSEDPNQEQ